MILTIDVVSDVVCPWCFIGKRRLESALQLLAEELPDVEPTIRWLPYFLNPDSPVEGEPYRPFLEKKFGGPEKVAAIMARVAEAGKSAGLEFAYDKIELRANTLRAHRLIHRFAERGSADALVERLFAAHFLRGEHVGDLELLSDIAAECGDDRGAVHAYLAGDEGAAEVAAQAGRAQAAGVNGVPFFIFNGRLALSGAQSPETLLETMRQAMLQT